MDVDVKQDLVNCLRPLGPTAVIDVIGVFGLTVVYYEQSIQHSITNKITIHFKTTSHSEDIQQKKRDI